MKKNMKLIQKTSAIFLLATAMAFGGSGQSVSAQSGCESSSGSLNLSGYLLASNIEGKIYLDSDSYEGNTSEEFGVRYNKNSGLWEGKAWAENYDGGLGYIDFSYDQINQKAIVSAVQNGNTWGNWDGVIDLSGVKYNNQTGSFLGSGQSMSFTGTGPKFENDVMVGLGLLDFTNVVIAQDTNCTEYVNLFIKEDNVPVSRKHYSNCNNRKVRLVWSSENVHECKAVKGPWKNPGHRNVNSIVGEESKSFFGSGNAEKELFSLECIGDDTRKPVIGYAMVACGETSLPESVDAFIKPIFKEV